MSIRGLALRPSEGLTLRDYLIALAMVGVALVVCRFLDFVAPGVASFFPLLPTVVLAGVCCGTVPAAMAASVGGIVNIALFAGQSLLVQSPFSSTFGSVHLAAALLLPACAIVLWVMDFLRRSARLAGAAEARLGEVFRQIPGAAAILEAPSGRLLMRSAQSQNVLGHAEGQVERSEDLATYGGLHENGRPFAADEYPIVRALKSGEIVRGERFRYRKPGAETVDLEVHAGPVRDGSGRIVAAVGMAFDVSDRVESERRLQESEARHRAMARRLRAALDVGEIGLWELDLATERVQLDAKIAALLGLPAEPVEMTRADMQRFVDPEDRARAREVAAHAIAKGADYADEVRMRTARGEPRWFAVRGAVLQDARKVIGVVRDVTQRRRREEALQEALRARDLLMQEADHRIKNSLQLVVSLLTLQAGRTADPDARHALAQAIAQVHTVADVHLGLQHAPDLRSIEIDQMLRDICHRLGALNPSVTLRYDMKAKVRLDAERAIPLGLVVCELVTNALRHAFPAGRPGEIALATCADGEILAVTVADGGIGLPPAPRRAGLGTTVIAAMSKQIGATVDTASTPGHGTRATIRLNVAGAKP